MNNARFIRIITYNEMLYEAFRHFTSKGRIVTVKLKNGKKTTGIVERCIRGYADVKVGEKIVLINSNYCEV